MRFELQFKNFGESLLNQRAIAIFSAQNSIEAPMRRPLTQG
jgi:hypothetical protein